MPSLNIVSHIFECVFEFNLPPIMRFLRKDFNPVVESPYSNINIKHGNIKVHSYC
jgi:hypothetical protein